MSTRATTPLRGLRGGRLLIVLLVGIAVVLGVARGLTALYVEVLWQSETGYLPVFWRRASWEWGTQVVAGLLVAGLVFVNLRIAASTLGGIQIRRRFGNLEISEQIPRRYVTWSLLSAAALIGLWFGASVPAGIGRQVLLAASAPAWGQADPVLARDLGFYAFRLPVMMAVVTYGMIVGFMVFTLATAGYAATGAVSWVGGQFRAHSVARMHLGSILAVFFLLLAVRLWLGRFELLIDGSSEVQGIFGFTDDQARLPALQTLAVLCFAASLATAWGAVRNLAWPLVASFSSVVLGTVLIGNLYPAIIQSLRVEPNELQSETPYIDHSLAYTKLGFGLDESMERRAFAYDGSAEIDWSEAGEQMAGLPVWGAEPLRTTYRQVQARFPYYDFDQVAIDRYPAPDGRSVPLAVSVRQVDGDRIPEPNWQNLHLRELFVAGAGGVVSEATGKTDAAGPRLLLAGLPPELSEEAARVTSASLSLERPQIYYGTRRQTYAIVTPGAEQFLGPEGTPGVPGVDFPAGIALSSALRQTLLAWHFRTLNLLFSSEVSAESRLVHRRRVIERALEIAPFLRFPEPPYPVVSGGRVVWILEGFTGTSYFPLSASYRLGGLRPNVRYVRNSVKVTVDAVTGAIDFYRVPIEDPLADGYEEAYPGLLQPMEEMPAELRAHLRYPRVLLDLQGDVLLQYHQETAPEFHGQQDVWRTSSEFSKGTDAVPYEPEYGIFRLPGESEARFQLSTVFVPSGRQNLTAMLVGRTDDRGRPETLLYDVAVSDEVPGPRLIEASIEQDPIISEQFSLWRTGGSEVWTGHLHLVPVGDRLLYMEPVFLAAADDAVPQLRRFVVSDGERVVMTETLAGALRALAGSMIAEADPLEPGPAGLPGGDITRWPTEALELLERAEARASRGDWQGFGQALEELRALLLRLQAGS